MVSTLVVLSVLVMLCERLTTNEPVFLTRWEPLQYRSTGIDHSHCSHGNDVRYHLRRHRPVGRVGDGIVRLWLRLTYSDLHIAYGPAIAIAMAAACFYGLLNGLMIVVGRLQPFIATLGTMSMARGTVLLITRGRSISDFPPSFYWFGRGENSSACPSRRS